MSLRLILLAAIVALNGFFASAEVALVSVRRSRLKELAEQGSVAGARRARTAGESRTPAEPDSGRRDARQPGPGMGRRGHRLSDAAALFAPLVTPRQRRLCYTARASRSAFLVHQLCSRGGGRSGAEESGDRKGRPPGAAGGAGAAGVLPHRGPFVFVVERSAAVLSRALGSASGRGGGGHSAGRAEVHRRIQPQGRAPGRIRGGRHPEAAGPARTSTRARS